MQAKVVGFGVKDFKCILAWKGKLHLVNFNVHVLLCTWMVHVYYLTMFYVMYIYSNNILLFVRFSPFVKSGTENFILGLTHLKREPKESEIVNIVVSVTYKHTCTGTLCKALRYWVN